MSIESTSPGTSAPGTSTVQPPRGTVVADGKPARRHRPLTGAQIAGQFVRYLILIIAAVLFLVPFYLILRNGLASDPEITSPRWTLFPEQLHWENFGELFSDKAVNILGGLRVSAIVAVLQTIGQLLFSSMAGYGLARIPYKHANKIFYATLVTLMIPAAVTFIPTFLIVSQLRWVNTLQGIIVPTLFSGFTTFLFRQYFLNFPKELEEAARVDGLGWFGAFIRVVVPNSLAFFSAIAVITFINSWNAFLWPLVIGQDSSMWTVQVALSTLMTAQTINLHELFLAAAVAIAPLVLVFLFLQRYLVQGVAETGLKG
ncbi:carbohydrate ABC transporter permease [Microlunatus elymi]|uniref:Carbohydrate ABC transporter permease n=1 Tax=Microlunatus elymi TaxID=2596828 RepID=A0A516PZU3_9ACTN|nr:carbohydrate ABC transporter permease [Microlunatus elymi]QDP96667.1 carbohydrate ABC transporter permease [Microlunatus elymi]